MPPSLIMDQLNLPSFAFRVRQDQKQTWIFDEFRKKFVVLTPEEWVRQHFLNYLVVHLKYPRSLIRVEAGHKLNRMEKRTDILVFDNDTHPLMLVECKSTKVLVKSAVFDQLAIYNKTYQARYLVITNGLKHYCCSMDYKSHRYDFMEQIPPYGDVVS